MGCGCKNKGNQAAQTQTAQQQQPANTPNIQESIKKVVEKYYAKK